MARVEQGMFVPQKTENKGVSGFLKKLNIITLSVEVPLLIGGAAVGGPAGAVVADVAAAGILADTLGIGVINEYERGKKRRAEFEKKVGMSTLDQKHLTMIDSVESGSGRIFIKSTRVENDPLRKFGEAVLYDARSNKIVSNNSK